MLQLLQHKESQIDGRPFQGVVNLNPVEISSEIQNFDTNVNIFFMTVFHELMHIICISSSLFSSWINPSTGKPYGNDLPFKSVKANQRNVNILHTPVIHQWASHRFGVDEFWDGVPSGLEMEDEGGGGTAGSHPEQTIYYPDVMVGIEAYDQKITELAFIMMEDSGWYEVDYRATQFNPYGFGPSIGQSNLTNFPNSPPQIGFPDHYICRTNFSKPRCIWNYRGFGYCFGHPSNCLGGDKQSNYCRYPEYYDPLSTGYISDFPTVPAVVPYPFKTKHCLLDRNIFNFTFEFESRGTSSFCHETIDDDFGACIETRCNDNGSLTLISNLTRKSVVCRYNGEIVKLDNFSIRCSNPVHICGIIKYENLSH